MSIHNFVKNENIHMLWDILNDEEMFKYLAPDIKRRVSQVFSSNIQAFYETNKNSNITLVELNKKYSILIINHIKQTYPRNKIKIHTEKQSKELITYEDLQNNKKTKFDNEFTKRQSEFNELLTIKEPSMPEFADKNTDQPIKEMDKIIKEMQMKRNYEIEQINQSNSTNETTKIDNWLKPQETSLKSEKLTIIEHPNLINEDNHTSSRFKHLNTLENITTPTKPDKKNVSWSNTNTTNTFNVSDDCDDNIFLKFKKNNLENVKREKIENIDNVDNITLEIQENIQSTQLSNILENRLLKLESDVSRVHYKLDQILEFLQNR